MILAEDLETDDVDDVIRRWSIVGDNGHVTKSANESTELQHVTCHV